MLSLFPPGSLGRLVWYLSAVVAAAAAAAAAFTLQSQVGRGI